MSGTLREVPGSGGTGGKTTISVDEILDLALHEQAAGLLSPGACLRRVWSKDRAGYLPDMFARMPEVDDLHGPRKVFGRPTAKSTRPHPLRPRVAAPVAAHTVTARA